MEQVLAFVRQYCSDCHQGEDAEAQLNLGHFQSVDSMIAEYETWEKVARRVDNGEMPPDDSPAPSIDDRRRFVTGLRTTLQRATCADGIAPGPPQIRRLNRHEYANTVRDLLGIQVDAGHALPADGAGGEGFDNAAETLYISPLHAEKYLEAADVSLEHALRDPRARRRLITAEPSDELSTTDAARRVLSDFLPRAFRRPVDQHQIDHYVEVFAAAYERDPSYEVSLRLALQAALVSPKFLFVWEASNPEPSPVLVTHHELASRLSYFLWATMPDEQLLSLADKGKLREDGVLQDEVRRMLSRGGRPGRRRRPGGHTKVRDFSSSFVEQWLGTRALGREFKPDPTVAGRFDSELEGGMKYEPIFFFEDVVIENRSLLNLIDSDFTYVNRALARHYGIRGEFREQPIRVELPEDSHRGGVLGMSAVLAVSSYPHRTSPVLRGKWILETLLGTPPPPPPPDVPELEVNAAGADPISLRQRLERHRENRACAACHDRIDPLGFGLENFDVLGRWRTEADGVPIDSRGTLPGGTEFEGPEELKGLLLDRKQDFARHLTAKMLGYALGRGLTQQDACTVQEIVDQLADNDYAAHTLIMGIVQSVPFQYKQGTNPGARVKTERTVSQEFAEGPDP
jgi:hypothetical protein